jgi:hypothetical protein
MIEGAAQHDACRPHERRGTRAATVSHMIVNRPEGWAEAHASAWARLKEVLREDWAQTKLDLHLAGRELVRASAVRQKGTPQATRHAGRGRP